MIEHIPELMESGIQSFKIEGRMKSAYYTAVTVNTYRMAMDAYMQGEYQYRAEWMRELESVSHREYATGYYYSDPHTDANIASDCGYLGEKSYLATVVSYDPGTKEALCIQKNKFSVGDILELLTPGSVGTSLTVEDLFDANHEAIASVPHPQMNFFMKVPFAVKAGDILRSAWKA